jgi:ribosomal protein S18 acetylase RimI-like enzyme
MSKNFIRKYKRNDLNQVLEVYDEAESIAQAFLDKDTQIWQKNQAENILKNNPDRTWVAEQEQKIFGFASTFITNTSDTGLAGLFVLPYYQGQGIGSMLLKQVKSSKKNIELAVYKQNTQAFKFYVKHGFTVVQEELDRGYEFYVMKWNMPKLEKRYSRPKAKGFGNS